MKEKLTDRERFVAGAVVPLLLLLVIYVFQLLIHTFGSIAAGWSFPSLEFWIAAAALYALIPLLCGILATLFLPDDHLVLRWLDEKFYAGPPKSTTPDIIQRIYAQFLLGPPGSPKRLAAQGLPVPPPKKGIFQWLRKQFVLGPPGSPMRIAAKTKQTSDTAPQKPNTDWEFTPFEILVTDRSFDFMAAQYKSYAAAILQSSFWNIDKNLERRNDDDLHPSVRDGVRQREMIHFRERCRVLEKVVTETMDYISSIEKPADDHPLGFLTTFKYTDLRTAMDEKLRKICEPLTTYLLHGSAWKDFVDVYKGFPAHLTWGLQVMEAFGIKELTYHPVALPDKVRFEHQWLIALPGSGKTTLLIAQILEDLKLVEAGKASVIVIDSQGENRQSLFRQIARLKEFAPGQPLHDRLVLLEPSEKYPLALNPFDMGADARTPAEQAAFNNSVPDMIKMSLAPMNQAQDDMLTYVVQLVLSKPKPTLDDVLELLMPKGIERFATYLARADTTTQRYFTATFDQAQAQSTKDAVRSRVAGMLRVPAFRNMFLSETRKFSLAKEIEQSKVIVVNTDKTLIGKFGSQFFGRFIIALLHQASLHRMDTAIPVFCYVDECHEYIADDENVSDMADQVRKRNIALIFSHQRMVQIDNSKVKDALANMGIRLAGRLETDAKYLAGILHLDTAEPLINQPQYSFSTYVSDLSMRHVRQIVVDSDKVRQHLPMTEEEYAQVQANARRRYCGPLLLPVPTDNPLAELPDVATPSAETEPEAVTPTNFKPTRRRKHPPGTWKTKPEE